jgi:hypothetical protein
MLAEYWLNTPEYWLNTGCQRECGPYTPFNSVPGMTFVRGAGLVSLARFPRSFSISISHVSCPVLSWCRGVVGEARRGEARARAKSAGSSRHARSRLRCPLDYMEQ